MLRFCNNDGVFAYLDVDRRRGCFHSDNKFFMHKNKINFSLSAYRIVFIFAPVKNAFGQKKDFL